MTKFLAELSKSKKLGEPPGDGRVPAGARPAGGPHGDAGGSPDHAERLRRHQCAAIGRSGLFDERFYRESYPDTAASELGALEHFFGYGYLEGRRPNPYFDPAWYGAANPDVAAAGLHPLLHYALHGEAQGRRPGPLFDPAWYRERYGLRPEDGALAHYLAGRRSAPLSPLPEFDAESYAARYKDVAQAKVDLFEHYLAHGHLEGRSPSDGFDARYYRRHHMRDEAPGAHPFLHWLANKHRPGVHGRLPDGAVTVARETRRFARPGPDFEERRPLPAGMPPKAMALAYYLPQFHAFAENDAWWGKGFTEWTNLVRGQPRFAGHYQPRIPRDLGFYALDSAEPMRRQARMAREAGLHGFVAYHYWFNGKRLMDAPMERFLADPTVDMPFALMWANENWTRRWDGADSEVLVSQDYRPEDDAAMVADFARHFADARYIRLQGRPLLMVYRPGIIPDARRAIARWRALFAGLGEDPIIAMAQAFGDADPRDFGLDGAIEFPPHKLTGGMRPANPSFDYLDEDFDGMIYRYEDVVAESLREPAPPYPLIKTAVPSWDNDARRQGSGLVITGSTPSKYEAWLSRLVASAQERPFFGTPIVCINAWNEWCEAAYLEPDAHYGAAYLNATSRALAGLRPSACGQGVALIGHDAFPSGAQHNLLAMGRSLASRCGARVEFVLLAGGDMMPRYREAAETSVCADDAQLAARLALLASKGFSAAIVNTSAAARAVAYADAAGLRSVLLVHEMPKVISDGGLGPAVLQALGLAAASVFPARSVRDQVLEAVGRPPEANCLVRPQGSYAAIVRDPEAASAFRAELGLPDGARLALGVGYADLRKGFDLFLGAWRAASSEAQAAGDEPMAFAWVGGMDPGMCSWLAREVEAAKATGTFFALGYRQGMAGAYSAADAFLLTSREDPFPAVVLEAMSAGVEALAFDGSGGIPDMMRETGEGTVVPYGDAAAMGRMALAAARRSGDAAARERRAALVRERFDYGDYARSVLRLALPGTPSVSVAVTSYDYARYMPGRLASVFAQTLPVHEVIVLDDRSADGSPEAALAAAEAQGREIALVVNEANSGSVFAQWRKAAELASGDFLWIAEADDLSEPEFLERVAGAMAADPSVSFGFADSRTVDAAGARQWPTYKPYYAEDEPGALAEDGTFDGKDFLERFMATRNLVLNASAVVWRREALLRALDACAPELEGLRMAGDWRLYIEALAHPGARVAYVSEPLNVHRRHAESVTHALRGEAHVAEVRACHAAAREKVALREDALAKQDRYAGALEARFGAAAAATQGAAGRGRKRPERRGQVR